LGYPELSVQFLKILHIFERIGNGLYDNFGLLLMFVILGHLTLRQTVVVFLEDEITPFKP
jgi:hypothetical protein